MAAFPTTVNPDFGGSIEVTPKTLEAPFGDGYVQRSGDGINTQLKKIDIRFTILTIAEADEIVDFLETQNGVTSFTFTAPRLTSKSYISRRWVRRMVAFNNDEVVVEMQEVPA